MQNFDFYSDLDYEDDRKAHRRHKPEFFHEEKQSSKSNNDLARKKANRLLSIVIGLCIASFTAGLIFGLKFSNNDAELVDAQTKDALSQVGRQATTLLAPSGSKVCAAEKNKKINFSKKDYPYIAAFNSYFDQEMAEKSANYLSKKNYTVIVDKKKDKYILFVGPYQNKKAATVACQEINNISNKFWDAKATVIER